MTGPDRGGDQIREYVDVLVVDDDDAVRSSVAAVLRSARFVVAEAANSRVALEMLRRLDAGVLVLDMRMSNVDGMGVLDALEGPQNVVLIAAHSFSHLDLDDNGLWCLQKPVQPRTLIEAVEHALRRPSLIEDGPSA